MIEEGVMALDQMVKGEERRASTFMELEDLKCKMAAVKAEKRELEVAGWNTLVNFEGTLMDALAIGLVKPAIATPDGWLNELVQAQLRSEK
jgi:hypothetical protein